MAAESINLQLAKRLGPLLQEHVSFRDISPVGLGGVADYYAEASTLDELVKIFTVVRELEVPWILIGSGHQSLMSDFGFAGMVIRNRIARLQYIAPTAQVLVDSGASWQQVVMGGANHDLGGLESLLLLPGTVGAVIAQKQVSETGVNPLSSVRRLTVLSADGEVSQMSLARFQKSRQSENIILIATLQLVHTRREEIIRRIGIFEKQRRRFAERRFLGPVFSSDYAAVDPAYLLAQFQRAKVLGARVDGAIFSADRPNYIEIQGKSSAQDVRQLITDVFNRLSDVMAELPLVQIKFIGRWVEES